MREDAQMNVNEVFNEMVKYENQKVLFESKVADSLQFLKNSGKKLRLAELEIKALTYVNTKIKESYENWSKDLFDNGETSVLPITVVEYFGSKMIDDDAIEKIVGSFFHYLHSFYDSYAQFLNSALLENGALDINDSSFFKVRQKLSNLPEYQTIFDELERIAKTLEYRYIDDFNNINKHQFTLELQSALSLNDGAIDQEIPGFQKKGTHEADELTQRLHNSLDMTLKLYQTVTELVMNHLKNNSNAYTQNRFHTISVKTQIGFGDGGNGGAIFITLDDPYTLTNGESYYVLLAKKDDSNEKIKVENILTDSLILQNTKDEKLGLLEAHPLVNPNILTYRKYKLVLTIDIEKAYLMHFFSPKTFQNGFGVLEIISTENNQEESQAVEPASSGSDVSRK